MKARLRCKLRSIRARLQGTRWDGHCWDSFPRVMEGGNTYKFIIHEPNLFDGIFRRRCIDCGKVEVSS